MKITMDLKEKQLFDDLHKTIMENTFGEKDVYLFLIMLRRFIAGKGENENFTDIALEFCHFPAHRSRDQGKTYDIAKKYVDEKYHVSLYDCIIDFNKKIINGINNQLAFMAYSKIPSANQNDFLLCIISLMQQARIKLESQANTKLFMYACREHIGLVLEADYIGNPKYFLSIPNINYTDMYWDMTNCVNSVFRVEREKGKLQIFKV